MWHVLMRSPLLSACPHFEVGSFHKVNFAVQGCVLYSWATLAIASLQASLHGLCSVSSPVASVRLDVG
jgi:hypothetical protein